MAAQTSPKGRTATEAETGADAPVTLMNSFLVPEGRDDEFLALWLETSEYFRAQPGFLSLRLHRAVTPGTSDEGSLHAGIVLLATRFPAPGTNAGAVPR